MSSSQHPVGNIKRSHPAKIADSAAAYLFKCSLDHRLALTVNPRGDVNMEPVTDAVEADLIGVYTNKGRAKAIAALILEDLLAEIVIE